MSIELPLNNQKWNIKTRKQLAESWMTTPAIYDAHTLQIDGHPVMEDWEANYMARMAQVACSQGGQQVLEIGFGLGLSAQIIQQHPGLITHTLIECHPEVLERCRRDFAEELASGRLRLLNGFWQDVVPLLTDGSFDGVLFDAYPLVEEDFEEFPFAFFEEAYRLLRPGGVFTYFSSEKDDFSSKRLRALHKAGFFDIHKEVCHVDPPATCRYWKEKTIIVPIIRKPKYSDTN